MARGLTELDVHNAADDLVAGGERPTVERIRAHLGTGSPNTVTRHLDTWWSSVGTRLRQRAREAAQPDVPAAVLTLAQRLGRPASWWLPTSLAPIMVAYALPLTDSRPWEPSRIPKSLLAVCSGLVESNGGLSAEVCALAPQWHAIG